MSTRSNIRITEKFGGGYIGSILLYKHHDGYPDTMIPFLEKYLKKSGHSAEWMAKQMLDETECEVASGLHGDIAYFYHVDIDTGYIKAYKMGIVDNADLEKMHDNAEKVAELYVEAV